MISFRSDHDSARCSDSDRNDRAVTNHHPRIPVSTYRLQFNRQFTFRQAREIVPYLHELGVTDCYASPYFQARAESLHGYDITDHNKLNAAIGSREDYDAWIAELHAHGMGQILDFVPNHMGIGEPRNQWWMDVLENGPSSIYAPYFDIDWHPLKPELHDKVLLPILGDQYGRVLERGELQVHYDDGSFFSPITIIEFPIAPGTYRYVLDLALEKSGAIQRRGILRGAPKHSDRARISAASHRNRSGANRRTHAREGDHQAATRAALSGSAASARSNRRRRCSKSTARRAIRAAFDALDATAQRSILPARFLARGRGGNQLSALLRCQRSGRDPHGVAGGFRRYARLAPRVSGEAAP